MVPCKIYHRVLYSFPCLLLVITQNVSCTFTYMRAVLTAHYTILFRLFKIDLFTKVIYVICLSLLSVTYLFPTFCDQIFYLTTR